MAYKINEDLYIGNTNTQLKDLLVFDGDTLPIGSIIPYGSSTTPSNWLKCDGSAVSRTTYSELFSVIGTLYGSGDGSTTFNLPNLKGKVTIGQDTTDSNFNTIGKTGGEKTHTLTISEMPKHTHEMRVVKDNETNSGGGLPKANNSQGNNNGWSDYEYDINNYAINNKGEGQAHNNMPPYIVTNYIIKANHTSYVGEESVVQTSYSTSTTDTYSCNYINEVNANANNLKPVQLYSYTGTNKQTSITLNDSYSNYKFIEIYAQRDAMHGFIKMNTTDSNVIDFNIVGQNGRYIEISSSHMAFNNTSVSLTGNVIVFDTTSGGVAGYDYNQQNIIRKIYGYKE